MYRIGLIADTHGLLRAEALAYLHGVDHIIHAGDIGGEEILIALRQLAPLTVVRGNNDQEAWCQALPERVMLTIADMDLLVLHNLDALRAEPPPRAARVVIAGHSHKPAQWEKDGVLYVNPGSAGPRRFSLPISVGELRLEHGKATATLHSLTVAAKPPRPARGS